MVRLSALLLLLAFGFQAETRGDSYGDIPWKQMAFVTREVGHCWGDRGLLRTEDGGRTWIFLNDSILRTLPYWGGPEWVDDKVDGSPCLKPVFAVYFITPEIGWMASLGNLLCTTDGGKSWNNLTAGKPSLPSGRTDYFINDLQFTNETEGWMLGGGALFRSSDAGRSWRLVRDDSISRFRFWASQGGLLLKHSGEIERTLDGGEHWEGVALPELKAKPDGDWALLNASTWWLTTSDGLIQTLDQGKTWTKIKHPLNSGERLIESRLHVWSSNSAWLSHEVERTTSDGSASSVSRLYEIRDGQFGLLYQREDYSLIPFLLDEREGLVIMTGPLSGPPREATLVRTKDRGRRWETVLENRCYSQPATRLTRVQRTRPRVSCIDHPVVRPGRAAELPVRQYVVAALALILDDCMTVKPLVFISCGQCSTEEIALGKAIEAFIREKTPYDAYFAERQNTLEGLSSNILSALNRAAALVAVMHHRGTIATPSGTTVTRGSVWVEQEIAIAAFIQNALVRRIEVALYLEKGITREGIRSQLRLAPVEFSEPGHVLADLANRVETWNLSPVQPPSLIAEYEYRLLRPYTGKRHPYKLLVNLFNNSPKMIDQWKAEIWFPSLYREGVIDRSERYYESDNDARYGGDEKRIWPGQRRPVFDVDYVITHDNWPGASSWSESSKAREKVKIRVFSATAPVWETEIDPYTIQNF